MTRREHMRSIVVCDAAHRLTVSISESPHTLIAIPSPIVSTMGTSRRFDVHLPGTHRPRGRERVDVNRVQLTL